MKLITRSVKNKTIVRCLLTFIAGGLPAIAAQAAEVYRWVDARGKVHFSDQLPQSGSNAEGGTLTIDQLRVTGPPPQPDAEANQRQQLENERWFRQRTTERQAEEAQRAKALARQAAAGRKAREACDKAHQRLAERELDLKLQKGMGIRLKQEATMKARIEKARAVVERSC